MLEIYSGEFTDEKWRLEELSSLVELKAPNLSIVGLMMVGMRRETDPDGLCSYCIPTSSIAHIK